MKMNDIVKRRFAELADKATELEKTAQRSEVSPYGAVGGTRFPRSGIDQSQTTERKLYTTYVDTSRLKEWLTSVLNLLQRVFGEDSIHYRNMHEHYQNLRREISFFHDCKGIFQAAREDYEGGYLFNIRALMKVEVLDDALEQATELLNAGYKDPACVVAGVTLETTLKELCTKQALPHASLEKMNVDLCKAGVYNMAMQKQITAWAARRNDAAHGNWTAYNHADVADLIKGISRFIAENL